MTVDVVRARRREVLGLGDTQPSRSAANQKRRAAAMAVHVGHEATGGERAAPDAAQACGGGGGVDPGKRRSSAGARLHAHSLHRLGGGCGGTHASIAAFALVGAASTIIDVGAFWLLTDMGQLPPVLANAVGYCLGGLNSFALNGAITFPQRGGDAGTLVRLGRFAAARALCLVASSLFLAAALQLTPPLAAKALAVGMTFLLAYTLASRLVFR